MGIQCIQRLVSENAIIPGALNIIDDNLRTIKQSNQEIRNMLCILGREAKTLFIIENLRTIGAAYFLKRSRFMCLLPNPFNPIVDAHLSIDLEKTLIENRILTDILKDEDSQNSSTMRNIFKTWIF